MYQQIATALRDIEELTTLRKQRIDLQHSLMEAEKSARRIELLYKPKFATVVLFLLSAVVCAAPVSLITLFTPVSQILLFLLGDLFFATILTQIVKDSILPKHHKKRLEIYEGLKGHLHEVEVQIAAAYSSLTDATKPVAESLRHPVALAFIASVLQRVPDMGIPDAEKLYLDSIAQIKDMDTPEAQQMREDAEHSIRQMRDYQALADELLN